jgi:hypothetical protein
MCRQRRGLPPRCEPYAWSIVSSTASGISGANTNTAVTAVSVAVKTPRGWRGSPSHRRFPAAARARRLQLLWLTLRHPLRGIEPFFLRATVMRRRNTRLL